MQLRRATESDGPAMAEVFLAARARMTYLPNLHTDEETRAFIGGLPGRMEVWVVESAGSIAGFAAVHDDWLDHLYVQPEHQNNTIGTALLGKVKERRPDGIQFWAFQKNTGARRFYARHDCREVELTDGQGNEEREPDVRFVWP